jgi:hypothetical protein
MEMIMSNNPAAGAAGRGVGNYGMQGAIGERAGHH